MLRRLPQALDLLLLPLVDVPFWSLRWSLRVYSLHPAGPWMFSPYYYIPAESRATRGGRVVNAARFFAFTWIYFVHFLPRLRSPGFSQNGSHRGAAVVHGSGLEFSNSY
ncbi:hypothetical protein VTN96DRAFT_2755 [Rasamsonia emersonii]